MQLLSDIFDRRADERLKDGATSMADAFAKLRATSCKRLNAMKYTADVEHLDHLVASQAWTDAALALLAIELPRWKLRRLTHDDGKWHCALSDQRGMPDWLDGCVETHHPDMATAILDALREVISVNASSHLTMTASTPTPSGDFEPVLCDNYS